MSDAGLSPSIEIRPLRTQAELRACAELQRETWGADFSESVPPSILRVCQRIGGIAAGAFDERGLLLGFVFGLSGIEAGRPVHWSDMLAVRRDARGLGLGRRLKEYQRDVLRGLGVETIFWSFDPLEARNAHLNVERLCVEVVEYVEDMYGDSDSELHRGLGTDRLVVAWRIGGQPDPVASPAPDPPIPALEQIPVADAAGLVVAADAAFDSAPEPSGTMPDARYLRIEVPADIQQVKGDDPEAARRWRLRTRQAFQRCLARGYRVVGFRRGPGSELGSYLLAREGGDAA
jgi:predicted GNAT superfamily acetyltransferase